MDYVELKDIADKFDGKFCKITFVHSEEILTCDKEQIGVIEWNSDYQTFHLYNKDWCGRGYNGGLTFKQDEIYQITEVEGDVEEFWRWYGENCS